MNNPLALNDLIVDFEGIRQPGLVSRVHRKLKSEGAALIRNTGMTELSQMAEWAAYIGLELMDYEGGTGHRNPLGAGVLSVGKEPAYANIDPHNEMAYWTYYPRRVLFGCVEIPSSGGDTVIADNRRVTEDLFETKTGQKIFDLGVRYIRNYSDDSRPESIPSTKSWQESFEFDEWSQLVDYCDEKQWTLVRRADGSVQVSYEEAGYEYDPRTGRNLLFASMARLGRAFDNWPPFNSLPNDQRPYHMTFADGSEFSSQDLATMDRIFSRYSVPISWQPGDIAVLDNITWTHARPPFELKEGEQRRIGLLVSEPVQRRRIRLVQ